MGIHRLEGIIQNYDWGGPDYIYDLLGQEKKNKPAAEYWMGTHPRGMSSIEFNGESISLAHYVAEHPDILGDDAVAGLPFLFKILDVDKMLSIQNHPSKSEAEKGFIFENKAGIPLDAPYRNFKDPNHKPEAMIALSDFYLLHGFRKWTDIRYAFEEREHFISLLDDVNTIEDLFRKIASLPQGDVDSILSELEVVLNENEYGLDEHDHWAKKAIQQFCTSTYDRGVFYIYMMNLVFLSPGEIIFQEANLLHAYLQGQNVEIMANSDNVFRAGLTSKHIDTTLLIQHLNFQTKEVDIIRPSSSEISFPVEDFKLQMISKNSIQHAHRAEILFCLDGSGKIQSQDKVVPIRKGAAYFIDATSDYSIDWSSSGKIVIATF